MLMIMSLGSSLDSSRLRSMLWFNKTPLNHILQLLQRLPSVGDTQTPQNIPATPEPQPLVTPANPTPSVRAWAEAMTPNDFDRDHLKGWAFLNSCRLYISLCEDQFKDKQAKIHWALSFMKSRCAALYANSILQNEASRHVPSSSPGETLKGASLLNSAPRMRWQQHSPNSNLHATIRKGRRWMITLMSSRSWSKRQVIDGLSIVMNVPREPG